MTLTLQASAYLWIRKWYGILALLVIALLVLTVSHAYATDATINTTSGNITTITDTPTETTPTENITVNATPTVTAVPTPDFSYENLTPRRINQGDCVQPGETIDIAGVGWYSGLITYYGEYYDGYSGGGNTSIKAIYDIEARDLDSLYISDYFAQRKGWWYNYDPVTDANGDSSGYDRIFKVQTSCALSHMENATAVAEAMNESRRLAGIRANMSAMTQKTITGVNLIISKNTTTSFNAPDNTHYWLFGTENDDRFYDINTATDSWTTITFFKDQINDLSAGQYDVLFVKPGNNTIVEELYNKSRRQIISPFVGVPPTDIAGLQPKVVEDKLKERIAATDDSYEIWRIALQDPSVEISQLTQTPINENKSYVVVAGYTNANAGTTMTIQMDPKKYGGANPPGSVLHMTAVNNGGGGAYRIWNVSFIADYDILFAGPHDITVTSDTGGSGTIQLYVRSEAPANANPPAIIHYIDNSPFIPTPTPITITLPAPTPITVIQTVTVPVTPSDEQVNKQQQIIMDATVKFYEIVGAVVLVILIILILFFRWMWRIYKRARKP